MKLKNVPNILSAIRILLVFVFAYFFWWAFTDRPFIALLVFLIAGLTDVLDGYIARHYNCCSDLGKILDPLADKLMQGTVVISLWLRGWLPWWLAIPFVLKDVFMLLGGLLFLKKKKAVVVSSWFGKFAVCFFYSVVLLAVWQREWFAEHPLVLNILCAINLAVLISVFVLYGIKYSFFKKANKVSSEERNIT